MLRHLTFFAFCVAGALAALPAAAQVPVPGLRPDTMPVADTIPYEPPNPRGAFLRALVIPGWGHAYSESYTRGGVYLTLQSTSWFMLVKTIRRLNEVEDREDRLTGLAEDSLDVVMAGDTMLARILSDPRAYEAALLTYPGLEHARGLAAARRQQRQDWITYTLFFTFAASVDAYVSAHLKDFPGEITARPVDDGGIQFRIGIPVGGRR